MADRARRNTQRDVGHRASGLTQAVSHLTPPEGSPRAGHRQRRTAQPYEPIRFSRPSLPLDSALGDDDAHPCEKGGLAEIEAVNGLKQKRAGSLPALCEID
jgi:hypothetical protein